MDNDKMDEVKTANERLKTAGEYLVSAGEHAKKSGDGALVKKIAEIHKTTTETSQEITKKLDGKQG